MAHKRLAHYVSSGFSLLEMAIVLSLVSLVAGMGMSAGKSALDSAKVANTNNKISAIEAALTSYRLANNRIPCPADGTVVPSVATFGKEAGVGGGCASANFSAMSGKVVEGVVPVRTLNLPDDFMMDGWGHKFAYAATTGMTGVNAFVNYGDQSNPGLITINASGGSHRSTNAVYTLISYGPDGHGGYNAEGAKVYTGSVNADELTNCHCSSTGASPPAYTATYVAKDGTQDPANSLDTFDDTVRFKERFQMRTVSDEFNLGGNLIPPGTPVGFHMVGGSSDYAGVSIAVGDINGDGIPDLIIGASGVNSATGAVYVIFGVKGGFQTPPLFSGLDGTNGFVINGGTVTDEAGSSVAVGDINGDGINDIIIGAHFANNYYGSVFVVFGKTSGWAASMNLSTLNGTNGFRINNVIGDDSMVIAVGDVNGDGKADIIIGDPDLNTAAGAVYVVYGNSTWSYGTYTLDNTVNTGLIDNAGLKGFKINGINANDRAGSAMVVGDINGDGVADLIIGASGVNSAAGAVYVLYGHKGTWPNPFSLAALDGNNGFIFTGVTAGDRTGGHLAFGDVNGDGINDIVISAQVASYSFSSAGSVYVVFGQTAKWPKTTSLSTLNGTNGFRLDGLIASNWLGYSLAVGDINSDGVGDLVIGAVYADPGGLSHAGSVYVVFGKKSGWAATATVSSFMDGTQGFELDGAGAGDYAGEAVAAGDINGDGRADVITSKITGGWSLGTAYVYYGQKQTSGWTTPVNLGTLP